ILDLVVADFGANAVSVLIGAGNGTFTPSVAVPSGGGPLFVVSGDFNGDGRADIVTANRSANTVSLFLQTATSPITVTAGAVSFRDVALGATVNRAFTVRNTGVGTLSGTAMTAAPFSVVGGAAFMLAPNATQTVTVRFNPAAVSIASGEVTFTLGTARAVRI